MSPEMDFIPDNTAHEKVSKCQVASYLHNNDCLMRIIETIWIVSIEFYFFNGPFALEGDIITTVTQQKYCKSRQEL